MKRISIIVPCYNEEEVLDILYTEIQKYFDPKYYFNLVFIDDGSKDKTLEIVKGLSEKDERVKYVSFSRNFGKEAAMFAGLEAAQKLDSDAAILIDADLQDPPSLIPQMLEYYEQGHKHIYAKHKTRKGEPFLKTFFAMMFYKVYSRLSGNKNMTKGARDFCLLSREVIAAFLAVKDYRRFTKGIFTWVGFEKKCIEFDYVPRVAGKTKWSFKNLLRYAFLGIRQFSNVYLLVPKTLIFFSFLLLVYEVISGFLTQFDFLALKIEFLALLILIGIYYLLKVLYDVREQGLNRPIYLTNDSNIVEKQ